MPRRATERELLVEGSEFLRDIQPPTYAIQPILPLSYVMSITSPAGSGKSALADMLSIGCVTGAPMGPLRFRKGKVLRLLGENPYNAKLQLKAACLMHRTPQEALADIVVYPLGKSINEVVADIFREVAARELGPFVMVNVDTSAAYFNGNNENDRAQMHEHAVAMRRLAGLPGSPGVLVNCHPVGSPDRENLLPAGGKSFTNQLDGNLTLWNDGGGLMTVHHSPKFRAPAFDAFAVALHEQTIGFADGSTATIPVAAILSENEERVARSKIILDEDVLLEAIDARPDGTLVQWAQDCGWAQPNGQPYKMQVSRVLKRLAQARRLAKDTAGRWVITKEAGKK